jgi:hypothetical protein
MPSTIPTSPSSARTATTAPSSASPEPTRGAGKALVAIGGGTGLSALLRGLKHHVGSERLRQLTGVVTVTDDGGSSGRLRRELGVLPPGFPNGGGLVGPGISFRRVPALSLYSITRLRKPSLSSPF